MLILAQCLDLKSMLNDISYELRILICLVLILLALSGLKVFYFHCKSTHNVRKIKELLQTSRSQWRSGDLAGARPVSPLPKIERVPACLALRRRSSLESSIRISEKEKNSEHNSSNDSIRKLTDSPPSRAHIKVSTRERTETEPRRPKNQIMPSEMLL
jgi:hypothetical protein